MILYKATNIINNKIYIGKTCLPKLSYRKTKHEHSVNYGSNLYFHNALRKYGFENFHWEVLGYYNNDNELKEAEIAYIKYCKIWLKLPLYNLTNGGEGTNGYKHTDEAKALLRQKRLGIKLSKVTKIKMSQSNIGKHNYWSGKKRSNLTKQKMSISQKEIWNKRKIESELC